MNERRCPTCYRVIEDWMNGHCYNCDAWSPISGHGRNVKPLKRKWIRGEIKKSTPIQENPKKQKPLKKEQKKFRQTRKILKERKHQRLTKKRLVVNKQNKKATLSLYRKSTLAITLPKFLEAIYGYPIKCGNILVNYGISKERFQRQGRINIGLYNSFKGKH